MTPDVVMTATHDHRLMVLSVFVSILGAYAAIALVERIRNARGRAWLAWLVGGAIADGIGTWSMHYTGNLALRLPVPVLLDWPMVLISLLVAIIGSAGALLVIGRTKVGWPRAVVASILLGTVGISSLHYTAMAAIRMPPAHFYSSSLITVSVILSIALSFVAIMVNFSFRDEAARHGLRHHGGAWVRGSANPIMHYTAMTAVTFTLAGETPDLSHVLSIRSIGLLGIVIVPVMFLVVALLTTGVDRLQKQRALLNELFEQAPQAVALMSLDRRVVRVNREFTRIFGYASEEIKGERLDELIVPAEARDEVQKMISQLAQGQRVDTEATRQRKDGSRMYVSITHVPVSLPGRQIEVYAIYRDITERQRAKETIRASTEQLRALSARLQSAREEEGTRIAREIHDELGSALSSLRWDLEDVDEVISELGEQPKLQALRKKINAMMRLTDTTVNTLRRISSELRPIPLDELGLTEAIEWQAMQFQERTGIGVNCDCSIENVDLNQEQATAVFRIFQEALTNILRHAQATRVDIQMSEEQGYFILIISDNGRGITENEKSNKSALGLLGMKERAQLIGGDVEVAGADGKGTVVSVRIPVSGRGD